MSVFQTLPSRPDSYRVRDSALKFPCFKLRKDFFDICVKDTGIGIEKCDIPKLFKEDVVFKKRGAGGEEGTGLGLLLCKEFVEKNDGHIWVESVPGNGSVFCFSIPVGHKKSN
ncbi:MAG: ATP-binding protein [Bacteroidetes bacterium]|nr:ATP-binding protein [Bacteroidota bacterium]